MAEIPVLRKDRCLSMMEVNLTAYENEPISGHTSKGDQPKWHVGTDWYKADHMGYEALSEVMVSWMLKNSTIDNFVLYTPVRILASDKKYIGCQSKNFRQEGDMLLPLEKLHRAYYGIGLAQKLAEIPEIEERIQYTVSFVEENTGLVDFGAYLSTLLELDAFILNEDRHTNNIAVIRNEKDGAFKLCPVFDNGLALLSDLNDYPLTKDIYECIDAVKAKPFVSDFAKQTEAASRLYGSRLKFRFTKKELHQEIQVLKDYYDNEIVERVERTILEQIRRYGYLF